MVSIFSIYLYLYISITYKRVFVLGQRRRRAEMAFLIVPMVFPNSITQGGCPYVLIFWINTLPFCSIIHGGHPSMFPVKGNKVCRDFP